MRGGRLADIPRADKTIPFSFYLHRIFKCFSPFFLVFLVLSFSLQRLFTHTV